MIRVLAHLVSGESSLFGCLLAVFSYSFFLVRVQREREREGRRVAISLVSLLVRTLIL